MKAEENSYNAEGGKVIAATVFKALTGKAAAAEAGNKGKEKDKRPPTDRLKDQA